MSSLKRVDRTPAKSSAAPKINDIYKNLFKSMHSSTYYACLLAKKAQEGNKELLKLENMVKRKFFIHTPKAKTQMKKTELTKRIRNLGGEVAYSVNRGIDFLVVSNQVFKMSNDDLLKSSAIFREAGQHERANSQNRGGGKSSEIRQVFNDRSLKMLVSSGSPENEQNTCMNAIGMTPKKKMKHEYDFKSLFEFMNNKSWNLVSVSDL